MLVFGGVPYHNGVVYLLELTSFKWSCIDNVKYKRKGHSADLIAGSIYLFGGYCHPSYKNDVHLFDIHN